MFKHEWEVYLREMRIAQFYAVRIHYKKYALCFYVQARFHRLSDWSFVEFDKNFLFISEMETNNRFSMKGNASLKLFYLESLK